MTQTYKFRKNETHFIIPVIRGIQGGKIFYTANLPMRHITEVIPPVNVHAPVQDRAQRKLNKKRAQAIAEYIDDNRGSYVLPAITISLMESGLREIKFEPVREGESFGELYIPINHSILLNDGQHRHSAIQSLNDNFSSQVHDTIALTIYQDINKATASQMFTDINLNAVRPSGSINTLYNNRDPWSVLAVEVSKSAKILMDRTECEKSTCAAASNYTFPLKAVVSFARKILPNEPRIDDLSSNIEYLTSILDAMHDNIRPWHDVTKTTYWDDEQNSSKEDPSFVQIHRQSSMALTVLMLESLALYAREAMSQLFLSDKRFSVSQDDIIKKAFTPLSDIDWSKDNAMWEGRSLRMGRVVKNKTSIILTANALLLNGDFNLPFDNQVLESEYSG